MACLRAKHSATEGSRARMDAWVDSGRAIDGTVGHCAVSDSFGMMRGLWASRQLDCVASCEWR
jgi:hypothetical protein